MNKPINFVLQVADTVTGAVPASQGLITVKKNAAADAVFSFPWKKIQKVERTVGVTEVAAAPTATAAVTIVAGTEYSFILRQIVGNEVVTEKISYTAYGADGINEVSAGWKSVLDALVAGGRIKATVTYSAPAVTITAAAGSPLLTLSMPSNSTNVVLAGTAGTAPVNVGADLLATGLVDSFDGDLPESGKKYTRYEFDLMLPKGYGGFNHQTDDQAVSLNIYIDDSAGGGYTALDGELTDILDGTYTTADLIGSNV